MKHPAIKVLSVLAGIISLLGLVLRQLVWGPLRTSVGSLFTSAPLLPGVTDSGTLLILSVIAAVLPVICCLVLCFVPGSRIAGIAGAMLLLVELVVTQVLLPLATTTAYAEAAAHGNDYMVSWLSLNKAASSLFLLVLGTARILLAVACGMLMAQPRRPMATDAPAPMGRPTAIIVLVLALVSFLISLAIWVPMRSRVLQLHASGMDLSVPASYVTVHLILRLVQSILAVIPCVVLLAVRKRVPALIMSIICLSLTFVYSHLGLETLLSTLILRWEAVETYAAISVLSSVESSYAGCFFILTTPALALLTGMMAAKQQPTSSTRPAV